MFYLKKTKQCMGIEDPPIISVHKHITCCLAVCSSGSAVHWLYAILLVLCYEQHKITLFYLDGGELAHACSRTDSCAHTHETFAFVVS